LSMPGLPPKVGVIGRPSLSLDFIPTAMSAKSSMIGIIGIRQRAARRWTWKSRRRAPSKLRSRSTYPYSLVLFKLVAPIVAGRQRCRAVTLFYGNKSKLRHRLSRRAAPCCGPEATMQKPEARKKRAELEILTEPVFWISTLLAVSPILIVTGVLLLVQWTP